MSIEETFEFLDSFERKEKHTEKEIEKYLVELKKLADNHNPKALYRLGQLFYAGIYVDQSFEMAFHYFNLSVKEGYIDSLLDLGYMYYYGSGVERSYPNAYKCFSKLALSSKLFSQEQSNAKYKLADMYMEGQYVRKDMDFAFQLLTGLISEENEKEANNEPSVLADVIYRLSLYYYHGPFGLDTYTSYKLSTAALKMFEDRRFREISYDEVRRKRAEELVSKIIKILPNDEKYNEKTINSMIWIDSTNDLGGIFNYFVAECYPSLIGYSYDRKRLKINLNFGNAYTSINEINYQGKIRDIDIIFDNTKSDFTGDLSGGDTKYEFKPIDDNILEITDSQYSKPIRITIPESGTNVMVGRIRWRDNNGVLREISNDIYNPNDFVKESKGMYKFALASFDVISHFDECLIPINKLALNTFDVDFLYTDLGLSKSIINDLEEFKKSGKKGKMELAQKIIHELNTFTDDRFEFMLDTDLVDESSDDDDFISA